MDDCLFCKIVKGEIPSYKIYEDEFNVGFLDIAGDYYGHTIVIPKTHCDNIVAASSVELEHCLKAVKTISSHFISHCGFSGVNVFSNCGKSAEQSINHLHFHIIPRKEGDFKTIYNVPLKSEFNFKEMADKLSCNL